LPRSANARSSSDLLHAVARSKPAPRSYRVKAGDNLWDIAKAQRVSVRDLQRWNKLSGSDLQVGQALFLQGTGGKKADDQPAPTYYEVKKGDSLYHIAKRFNVTLSSLM